MPRLTLNSAQLGLSHSQLQQLTTAPATLERLLIRQRNAHHLPVPKYAQRFPTTVRYTDGSTFTYWTSLPLQPRQVLVKDTVHHPLWNPRIRDAQVDKNSQSFLKFQRKFGQAEEEASTATSGTQTAESADAPDNVASMYADLAFSADEAAPVVIQKKQHTPAAAQKKRKR